MGTHWKDGYSAHVDLALLVDGKRLSIGQVGPDSFILRQPCHLEAGFADLVVRIDDYVETWRIALFEGADPTNRIVRYEAVGKTSAASGEQTAAALTSD
jgi:hypothetical protein